MQVDNAIFKEYDRLREFIGGHGDEIDKVRPTAANFEKWLDASNDVDVRGWVIIDHGEWQRDLVALEVTWNKLTVFGDRVVDFTTPMDELEGVAVGLVIHIPFLGIVINQFHDGTSPILPVEGADTLQLNYRLSYDTECDRCYIPNEDVDLV